MSTIQKIAVAVVVVLFGGGMAYYQMRNDEAEQQRDQLQAQVQALAAAKAEASKPELPVTVTFRHALIGNSFAADFHSHSSSDMAVAVDLVDSATHRHRTFEVLVGPNRTTDIGHMQNVVFEPGDQVTLSHDGYKPVVGVVP